MSDVLNHPELRDLEPQTEREGLLYTKAYLIAVEATMKAVEQFGLDEAKALHEKVMSDLASKLGGETMAKHYTDEDLYSMFVPADWAYREVVDMGPTAIRDRITAVRKEQQDDIPFSDDEIARRVTAYARFMRLL